MTKEEIYDDIRLMEPEKIAKYLADIYQKIESKEETIHTEQVNDLIEKYAHDYRNDTYMIHETEKMLHNFLTDYKNLHHE